MEKKYIIELDDNKLAYTAIIIDGVPYIKPLQLLPYTEPDLEQVRKEAYDECRGDVEMLAHKLYSPKIDGAYQRGLNDAWEAVGKIYNMCSDVRHKIFKENLIRKILSIYSASEAIEKIWQYEQRQEEQDGLRQNIQTIVDQCGYTLDEIAEVLKEMRGE